jgi:hypothetical protein
VRAGPQTLQRHGQVLGLEQGQDLGLVGEQDVDLGADEAQEGGAVALALSVPSIRLTSGPRTRLSAIDARSGWLNRTVEPASTPNRCHSMIAFEVA